VLSMSCTMHNEMRTT